MLKIFKFGLPGFSLLLLELESFVANSKLACEQLLHLCNPFVKKVVEECYDLRVLLVDGSKRGVSVIWIHEERLEKVVRIVQR